jgi:hypothetical protein
MENTAIWLRPFNHTTISLESIRPLLRYRAARRSGQAMNVREIEDALRAAVVLGAWLAVVGGSLAGILWLTS